MLKNYLKIAWRNIVTNKVFSIINITGLALGLTASILILKHVSYELSFDQFHEHKDNIYRVNLNIYKNGKKETQSARVSPAVASSFQKELSGIENYTRMIVLGPDGVLTYEDQYTGESDIFLADSAFFNVFSYELIQGNKQEVFNEPFCIVITESTAKNLFDHEDPIGKNVVINAKNFDNTSIPFKVTGVIADFPENSHLKPGVLISYPTLFEFVGHRFDESWQWNETYTYFRLQENVNPETLEAQFPAIVHQFIEQLSSQNLDWVYRLQQITDIHLQSDLQHEISQNGKAIYVYFLGIVGILILLIGYVNFINLATVKSLERAKEMGVRKITGAQRKHLIFQVFSEALLVNVLAILLASLLLYSINPYVSGLFDIRLYFTTSYHPEIWIGFAVFIFLLIVLSGFYPAFVLSGYEPVKVIKGNFAKSASGLFLRKSLVTTQFAIALVLIAITMIAKKQVNFMQQQSLGFDPEQILVVKSPKAFDYGYGTNFTGFQEKVRTLAHVRNVAGSNVVPGQEIYWYDDNVTLNGEQTSGVFSMMAVAPDYFSQYDIPLISGRYFTNEPADQNNWIMNESAIHLLEFEYENDALGQKINNGHIIGVVKDFHHESLKTAIPPILFNCGQVFNYYTVKLETSQLTHTMEEIKAEYENLFPGSPYEYFFLDEFFNRQYKAEQQFNALFGLFSGLAIFIACLGVFGLSTYTTSQRTKEIGVRKITGASVSSIVILLSKDTIKLMLIACLLGLPIAYLVMQMWLENYATRIEIDGWLLLLPVMIIFIISLITVSFQSIKAALANPTKSLRYE